MNVVIDHSNNQVKGQLSKKLGKTFFNVGVVNLG